MSSDSSGAVVLRLRNARASPLTFVLEPWGEAYPMPVGSTFEISAVGPTGGSLEVDEGDNHLTVYGWPGSTVTLHQDGVRLGGRGHRTPVPTALPPGMSVSGFVKLMFGGEGKQERQYDPRTLREAVMREITDRQWTALHGLLADAPESKGSVAALTADERDRLREILSALAGAQDIEHGLRDERAFFEKYPDLIPPWRRS